MHCIVCPYLVVILLRSNVDANILKRNVKLLAETLARHVYNLSSLVCVYIHTHVYHILDAIIRTFRLLMKQCWICLLVIW